MKRTGGELIVEALKANGVKRLSCVPGESFLAVLDALYDSDIDVVVCRQEGGAAMMADAWGRLTGEPGICMVTRGPGSTNATAGLHIARQDSIPMILFIGQVQRDAREREAFQEVEFRRALTEFSKWVGEIDDAARIPEFVTRAFAIATSGRPGPVVLSLPEDMLRDEVEAPRAKRYLRVEAHPGRRQIDDFYLRLLKAERPMVIVGGTRWDADAVADLKTFSERFALPVGCSFRRQMLFDHLHPNYAGDVGIGINPALAKEIKESDLLILLGGRMSEMPSSGYTLIDIPYPQQSLVHIYPDPSELGRVYRPDLAICASPSDFVADLADLEAPANSDGRSAPNGCIRPTLRGRHRRKAVPAQSIWDRSWSGSRQIRAPMRSSPTVPETMPPGCIGSIVSVSSTPRRHRHQAPWATACRPRLLPSSSFPNARSSVSPGTVVS